MGSGEQVSLEWSMNVRALMSKQRHVIVATWTAPKPHGTAERLISALHNRCSFLSQATAKERQCLSMLLDSVEQLFEEIDDNVVKFGPSFGALRQHHLTAVSPCHPPLIPDVQTSSTKSIGSSRNLTGAAILYEV